MRILGSANARSINYSGERGNKTFHIEVYGADEFARALDASRSTTIRVAGQLIYFYANEILNRSQVLVPVATGALRSSGRVEGPEMRDEGIEAFIRYGGAAAPYALYVHENLYSRHMAPTQAKFLEVPAIELIPKFRKEFAETMRIVFAPLR